MKARTLFGGLALIGAAGFAFGNPAALFLLIIGLIGWMISAAMD